MFKRTRYQFGSVERKARKKGPDVWALRYREHLLDGTNPSVPTFLRQV